jgi:hypothetical protein
LAYLLPPVTRGCVGRGGRHGPTSQERGGAGTLVRDGKMTGLSMVDAGAALVGRLSRERPGKGAAGAGKTPAAKTRLREVTMTDDERSRAILDHAKPMSSIMTR